MTVSMAYFGPSQSTPESERPERIRNWLRIPLYELKIVKKTTAITAVLMTVGMKKIPRSSCLPRSPRFNMAASSRASGIVISSLPPA